MMPRWIADGRPLALILGAMLALVMPAGRLAAQPSGAEPASLIVVFDGSGSMWGRLGTERDNKLDLARTALKAAIETHKGAGRLGLASFGHRRKGDCSDAAIVAPLAPTGDSAIEEAIDDLNPRGRGPLTLALRLAGQALGDVKGRRSIILLHDGLDNCRGDPCAAATALRKTAPGLAVHVISIGLSAREARKMQCVSQTTGGTHAVAGDDESLTRAVAAAFRLALPGAPAARAPASPGKTPPDPARRSGPPGLKLVARLGPGTPPLTSGVRWEVAAEGGKTASPPLYAGSAPPALLKLPKGRYRVVARLGAATSTRSVTVDDVATTILDVSLDAGILRLATLSARGGRPLQHVFYSVARRPSPTAPPDQTVAMTHEATPVLHLPAGSYVITVEHGIARSQHSMTVLPGSIAEMAITLNMGEIKLSASPAEGQPPLDNVQFVVLEDDPEQADGLRILTRTAANRPLLALPAGTYTVMARWGEAEARVRVSVLPGQTVERTIVLRAARLTLQSRLPGRTATAALPLVWQLQRLDTPERPRLRTTAAQPVLHVAAGRYRLVSQLGGHNARITRDIEIAPGQPRTIVVEHQAGIVTLALAATDQGPSLVGAYWEITTPDGRLIARSARHEPRFVLAAGTYRVTAERQARRHEAQLTVTAGEIKTVVVVAR
ncbi:MAG: VWA domain-containing protein [Hyphomicrobiaceae bacterium]